MFELWRIYCRGRKNGARIGAYRAAHGMGPDPKPEAPPDAWLGAWMRWKYAAYCTGYNDGHRETCG